MHGHRPDGADETGTTPGKLVFLPESIDELLKLAGTRGVYSTALFF